MSRRDQNKANQLFDSSSFEAAAKAAQYLDQSKNAKEAIELAMTKEKTKQLESEEGKVKLEIQRSQVAEEERRKTVQYETDMGKRRAEYQVQLELQKDQQKMQQKEQMRQDERARDEESIQRQEKMRRDTLEYQYQMQASVEQQKLAQELQAKRDLQAQDHAFQEGLMQRAEREKRETQKQNLVTTFNMVTSTLGQALSNPKMVAKTAYLSLCLFGTYHLTKMSFALLTTALMGRFGKPQLVRETSKIWTNNYAAIPFIWGKKFVKRNVMKQTEGGLLKGVILDKQLEDQLRGISYAVLNRKKHYAPAKNMLFYGPPGTGKTLFAKKLAMESGLEYAVMVGSDIAPLGAGAVTQLNKLFDWAESQPGGMVLFIDEADAFLRSRKGDEISEHMRHTINSFLYRTGSPSERLVVVLATNNPEQLDEAVHDRVDEVVGFNLPNENERRIMLFHYLVKYCQPPRSFQERAAFAWKYPKSLYRAKTLVQMEGVTKEIIEKIAAETAGFSGREITKMVIAWHDAAFTLPDAVLTPEIMEKVLSKFHLQHKLKANWTSDEQKLMEKLISFDDDAASDPTMKTEEMKKMQDDLQSQINDSRSQTKADEASPSSEQSVQDSAQKIQKGSKKV